METETPLALIVRDDRALTVSAGPDAAAIIEAALAALALIPAEIDTPAEQTLAVDALRTATIAERSIEQSREAVKKPVLDLCRAIDAKAKELAAELSPECLRVRQALGDYQGRLAEIAREEARKRAAEAERIERARLAELDRIRQEAEAKAAAAKAEAEANAIAAKAQADAQAATERATQQMEVSAPPVTAPPKAKGQSVRPVWCFEVTDIHLLYRSNPGLVRLEPNRQEIQELLARGITTIAGLRVWNETRVSVRTAPDRKAQPTLDV